MSKWGDVNLWASAELEEAMWTYRQFMGMFLHFKGDYDWFKYGDMVNVKTESFLARKDRNLFVKLHRKFKNMDEAEVVAHLAANFIDNPKCWVHFLVSAKADKNRKEFLAELQGFQYSLRTFLTDNIESICKSQGTNFIGLFKPVSDEEYPWFLRGIIAEKFPTSHMVAMGVLTGAFNQYDKMYENDPNWPTISSYINKIKGFYVVDIEGERVWLANLIKEKGLQ